jgi:hypothetical protein
MTRLSAAAGALALLICAFSAAARASLLTADESASGCCENVQGDPVSLSLHQSAASGPIGDTAAASSPVSQSGGAGTALVDFGRVSLFAEGSSNGLSPAGVSSNGGGQASGEWNELLTIHAPSPDFSGAVAQLSFTLTLNGFISASASGSGAASASTNWGVIVNYGQQQVRFEGSVADFGSGASYTGDPIGPLHGTLQFVWDEPTPIDVSFSLGAFTAASQLQQSAALATGAFQHTLDWSGIEVRDDTGALIPDLVATSESGFDYVHGVPEPAAAALLAVGAVALGRRLRRPL